MARSLLALLLGTITTVAVAWSLAGRAEPGSPRTLNIPRYAPIRPEAGMNSCLVARQDAFGRMVLLASRIPRSMSNPTDEQMTSLDAAVPRWARPWLVESGTAHAAHSAARGLLVTGWPIPCMRVRFEEQPSADYWWFKAIDGIRIREAPGRPDFSGPMSNREGALPTRIVPLPFIACALMWSALWSVPLFGPRIICRAARRRRGCCVECGHPHHGLDPKAPCPECGAVTAATARRTPT